MQLWNREEWTLASFFWVAMFFLGLALSTGCTSINDTFLRGEEAAYRAISPIYASYVDSDITLSEDARLDRLRTLTAWQFSLKRARENVDGQD